MDKKTGDTQSTNQKNISQTISGKDIAEQIKKNIADKISHRIEKGLPAPGLAVIIIGNNPASEIYVSHKQKACEKVGIISKTISLDEKTPQYEVQQIIEQLNQNPAIHGILVQQPLPDHYDLAKIVQAIDPKKDVDGFHPLNVGKLALRQPSLRPCTPKGIMTILHKFCPDLHGQQVCIIGASNIVGRPMALECLLAGCTVTVCHKFTKDLASFTKQAQILISAVGKANFITTDMVRPGAIVIDVGINRSADNNITGDVDFKNVSKVAGFITPVPGGIGPMTVATLLENTLEAATQQD